MAEEYGSDFITIVDEDGTEYELEVNILKNVEEDGEMILCAVEDEAELEAVYALIMDQLYEEDEEA